MLPNLSTTETSDERCRAQGAGLGAIALSGRSCASHDTTAVCLPHHSYDAAERHSTKDEVVGITVKSCLNNNSLKDGHMRQK
jgi:hypothetical protein